MYLSKKIHCVNKRLDLNVDLYIYIVYEDVLLHDLSVADLAFYLQIDNN